MPKINIFEKKKSEFCYPGIHAMILLLIIYLSEFLSSRF